MESIISKLTFIAKEQIERDIHDTSPSPCGVHLDESTLETLRRLGMMKMLSLADSIYDAVTSSVLSKKKDHPWKEVAHVTESERCILIALIGTAVNLVSSYIIGKRTGQKAAEEAFRSRIKKQD